MPGIYLVTITMLEDMYEFYVGYGREGCNLCACNSFIRVRKCLLASLSRRTDVTPGEL